MQGRKDVGCTTRTGVSVSVSAACVRRSSRCHDGVLGVGGGGGRRGSEVRRDSSLLRFLALLRERGCFCGGCCL